MYCQRYHVASCCGWKCSDFEGNLEEPVTPNYFLHSSWWIGDHLLLTGPIVLPFLVASTVIEVNNQLTTSLCLLTGIFLYGISSSLVSIFVMTFMSIDRWLHMKRNSMITVKRVYKAYFVMYLLPIPLITFRLVQSTDGCVFSSLRRCRRHCGFTLCSYCSVFLLQSFSNNSSPPKPNSRQPTNP